VLDPNSPDILDNLPNNPATKFPLARAYLVYESIQKEGNKEDREEARGSGCLDQ